MDYYTNNKLAYRRKNEVCDLIEKKKHNFIIKN